MKRTQIVCLAFPKWEGDYLKSTVQLMKCLSKDHDILYVDYTYTWLDVIQSFLGKKHIPVARILGLKPRINPTRIAKGQEIKVLRLPPILPINWISNHSLYNLLCKVNGWILLPFLKYALWKIKFEDPLIINAFQPWLGSFLKGKLGNGKSIYYCYDEISAAPWISKHGEKAEQSFLKNTDHTIVTSSQLLDTKSRINPNISIVKNGVDTTVFSKNHNPPFNSKEKEKQSRKVVGYLGSVDERLDTELLRNVISECKEYLFRFVGRITDPSVRDSLSRLPNVEFTGPMLPADLPHEVDKMDVCLIPFKINPLTAGIYPLKINEYLLRGKPVVATPFADLSDFQEVITIAKVPQAFKDGIISHLNKASTPFEIKQRKNFAFGNSWESRAQQFNQIIKKLAS